MAYLAAYPIPTCKECGLQSAGRCPSCNRSLCIDHFPREEHHPCRTRLARHARDRLCYVCGTPVAPQQWSSAVFAHYIDEHRCAGCHRFVCDDLHTRTRVEDVKIVRDGLRSHRYHLTKRYCGLCAPFRRVGGILGATWLLVGISGVSAASLLTYVEIFHRTIHL